MALRSAYGEVDRTIQDELLIESDRRLAVSSGATKVGNYIRPEGQISGYQGGQIIRFRFPSDGIIDFRNHAFTFGAVATPTTGGASQPLFPADIAGIISRVVLKINGQPIQDELAYNVFQTMESFRNDPDWTTTQGALLRGYSTVAATRQTNAADANKRYAVQFTHGLLHGKILPLKFMGEVTLELHLEFPNVCLTRNTAVGAINYIVSDCKLHFDVLNLDADFDAFVLSKIGSGSGMPILYHTYTWYQFSELSGANNSYQLPVKVSAAQEMYHVMRTRANITDDTVDGKLEIYNPNLFNNMRIKINNEYLPADRIEGFAEAWLALQDSWQVTPQESVRGATGYTTVNFILGQALDAHGSGSLSHGVNISQGSSSVIVELNLAGAPATPQVVDNFVCHENLLLVKPGRASVFYM